MRLIHLLESSMFHQIEGRIAVGTPETCERFQKFVEWLCECIKQDPEPIEKGGKMLIIWQAIGSVRLCLSQDLRAEILKRFPKMEIELQEMDRDLERFVICSPGAILRDSKLLFQLIDGRIRYLIVIL